MANQVAGITDSIGDAIQSLKDKAGGFVKAYQALMNSEAKVRANPKLYAEWKTLKGRADSVRQKIDYINGVVDSAAKWLKGVFGMSSADTLGVAPLIPIAYVTAAIAALVYVTSDIYKFVAKVDLIKSGALPAEALTKETGVFQNVADTTKNLVVLAVVGAVVFYLWKRNKQ